MPNSKSQLRPVWDVQDVALLVVDYQPGLLASIKHADPALVALNVKYLVRLAKTLNYPVVLSSVGVQLGFNAPTVESITSEAPDDKVHDRSSMDAWEDAPFVEAVKATGKRRLVIVGLYTEICLAYLTLEALAAGYEVMILTDAVAGLSKEAHERGIERCVQAGAIPNTTFAYQSELFRDWKSPLAHPSYEVLQQYLAELEKITGEPLMVKA